MNLLISEKTVFWINGINKCGPEYSVKEIKIASRAFLIVKKKKKTFWQTKINILDFAEKHLIPEICQCEQLGEQNLKSENLKIWQ